MHNFNWLTSFTILICYPRLIHLHAHYASNVNNEFSLNKRIKRTLGWKAIHDWYMREKRGEAKTYRFCSF